MMNNKTSSTTIEILNSIVKFELAGVIRYTHYGLMIVGRDRLTLKKFFEDQATESLAHAQQAGDIITGLGGHPSVEISNVKETNKHAAIELLKESAEHEKSAIDLYKELLKVVEGESIFIEEYAREMIKSEEIHCMELSKMMKDYS
tara:strand:+ start:256 stop:693 length:438 start_codon:yes stop_codon:yes gene_type:complete